MQAHSADHSEYLTRLMFVQTFVFLGRELWFYIERIKHSSK